jgi:hypothetical protein
MTHAALLTQIVSTHKPFQSTAGALPVPLQQTTNY